MAKHITLVITGVLFFSFCTKRIPGDWDVYEDGGLSMEISDSSSVGAGVILTGSPDVLIDSIAIEVQIDHEDYSNLDITLSHGTDTLLLWDNNYPGGTQIVSLDTLVGQPANVEWMLNVFDYVVDGNEGWLKKFTLMIRYQD